MTNQEAIERIERHIIIHGAKEPHAVYITEALNMAIEALKAQEPRVMTKEEIIGWDGYIWFEFSGMRAMKAVLIDHGMEREPLRGDYPTKELSWGTFQETWRAWTAKPTKEQREEEPWSC